MSTFDVLRQLALFDLEPDVDGAAGYVARKAANRATSKAVTDEITRIATRSAVENWNAGIEEGYL